ncbi:MAG: hypothetical protein PHE25_04085, partial [Candidatus Gracilibacteria bacterium]|nr:hypothetical protein [Candidatus Gracilibacteria bacterium]
MNKYKKIISGLLLSSLFIGNLSFTFADDSTTTILTQEEKIKVENEIVKLQSKLFDSSKTYFEKISSDFNKLTNYEENGNSKIELNVDQDFIGSGSINLNLNNYLIKNVNLDSETSANVDLKANYSPVYGSGFEFNLKTLASLISKDGEVYALLKDFDFKITDKNYEKILQKLKDEFSDNKYIKLPSDKNSQIILNAFKSFDPKSFFDQSQEILKKPLLTTYKKSQDKYLLIPTKYACDTYFEIDKQLNISNSWYEPKTCSETVYKSLITNFIKSGDLYLTFGENENIFGFNSDHKISDIITVNLNLNYNDKNISKINYSVVNSDKIYGGLFVLNYIRGESLNSNFYAEKGKYKMSFSSKLDENDNFLNIDSSLNFDKNFVGTLTLKDKKINGFYQIKQKGYDYTSSNWDYILKNIYGVKINGNMSSQNTLNNLDVKFAGVNIKNKKAFLVGKVGYNNSNFTTYLKLEDTYTGKFVINGNGKVELIYLKYDFKYDLNSEFNGNFNLEI